MSQKYNDRNEALRENVAISKALKRYFLHFEGRFKKKL